jgi:NTP pyrophosphatase (non-canonical NTP hydrolase)
MRIRDFQRQIEAIYFEKDSARGLDGTFRWFIEEVGELARAIRTVHPEPSRTGDPARLREEFADCLAWLSTMASICGVELEEAVRKYADGCPKCKGAPCSCE